MFKDYSLFSENEKHRDVARELMDFMHKMQSDSEIAAKSDELRDLFERKLLSQFDPGDDWDKGWESVTSQVYEECKDDIASMGFPEMMLLTMMKSISDILDSNPDMKEKVKKRMASRKLNI